MLVGRWWALAPALGFAVWIAVASEVEVSGWFLGPMYGVIGCASIATGIASTRLRQRLGMSPARPTREDSSADRPDGDLVFDYRIDLAA